MSCSTPEEYGVIKTFKTNQKVATLTTQRMTGCLPNENRKMRAPRNGAVAVAIRASGLNSSNGVPENTAWSVAPAVECGQYIVG
jgi:hypothetical protein